MDLIKYLPSFYFNSEEVKNIQASIQNEDIKVKEAIKDVLNQLFVDTATWGLDSWEKYLGLKIDKSESYINRRARIKMILRGQGTTTKAMIKNVCESFVNGKVCVIENNTNYSFVIKFIDVKGIPGNIGYIKDAVDGIKPAHLNFSFEYLYNTWGMIKGKTWGEVSSKTWEEIKVI